MRKIIKYIIIIIFITLIFGYNTRTTKINEDTDIKFYKVSSCNFVSVSDIQYDGITYKIFLNMSSTCNNGTGGIFVINHTKEILEIEKLRKNLDVTNRD